jgi:hypothetical protein
VEPYGLAAIVAFDRLPYLKTATLAGGQSSYDRTGGNDDFVKYNGPSDVSQRVILDLKGPGTVYRLWFTGFDRGNEGADINFYIDGDPIQRAPRLLRDLFSGAIAPFLPPLAGNKSAGYYSYVPLPFQESIRITTNGKAEGTTFYYNIGYHRYAPGTRVTSWAGTEDITEDYIGAKALWNNAGKIPTLNLDTTGVNGTASLASNDVAVLLDAPGPGSLSAVRLRLNRHPNILNNVWLRISWDRRPEPSVNAPLSTCFALGPFAGARNSRSLAVGVDDEGWMYLYFPMPFRTHARVELLNMCGCRVDGIEYDISRTPFNDDFSKVGYFTTAYGHRPFGRSSITILEVEGTGHLVGVVESIEGPQLADQDAPFCRHVNELCYLEGDERIYVDDSRTPAIHGTGTEDFFNAGWYFGTGPFDAPVHGCTVNAVIDGRGITSAYRLFLQDAVPFRKHLRVSMEHGPQNDVPVFAWTLAYYYYQPVIRAFPHDVLDVGDTESEAVHSYVPPRSHSEVSLSAYFEGDFDDVKITDSGKAHIGNSTFVFTIPPENDGVILRRTFDQGIADQRALVFVDDDDTPLGTWYRAGGNPTFKWCDDDFIIPRSVTLGKSVLHIRIQFVSSSKDWNEYRYALYVLRESGDTRPSLVSPRAPAGAEVGAVSRSDDQLDLFVADENHCVVTAAWGPEQEGTWYTWWPISAARAQLGAPVCVVSRSRDRLDAFFASESGEVYTAAWEPGAAGWRSWPITARLRPGSGGPLPAIAPASPVTVVSRSADHLDAFVVASDGSVYSAAWPDDDPAHSDGGAHWIGWWRLFDDLDLQCKPGTAVHAVSRSPDKLDVFVTDLSGEMCTAAWEPGLGWRGWRLRDRFEPGSFFPNVEAGAPVTVVSRSIDHLDIFVVGLDGYVYTAAWEPSFGGPWRGWWGRPDAQGRGRLLDVQCKPSTPVHGVSRSPDKLDVFVTDPSGEMYTAAWEPGLPWRGWKLRDRCALGSYVPLVAAASPIAVASRRRDYLDIFAVGTDSRIWTAAWQPEFNGPWRGWRPIGY